MNMKVIYAMGLIFMGTIYGGKAQDIPVRLSVDASRQIATVSKLFNGSNIEDLNNQTNGGIFSQLLHGEAFEENIDVDFLNLSREDYSKVYVVLDERKIPHLKSQTDIYHRITWNNRNEKYDFNSKDIYDTRPLKQPRIISGWKFPGQFLPFDSLPSHIKQTMLERINGKEQISRYWSKCVNGNPTYRYELVRDGQAYIGRQTQVICFESGTGEVGLTNHGLYRMGIRFDAGKTYDGVLRIKSEGPQTVYVSLRDENGNVLAEKACPLEGNGTYEKVTFTLLSSKYTANGSLGVTLKSSGKIELGFAFLEPGEWGRVQGYPLRKMFVDALRRQGIAAFRYNGSMVDVGADTYLYRWKKMLGPVDERRVTFRSGFNMYSTHSFGFEEMLKAAEVIEAEAIIGLCMDETYEDIRDFVEYVNGSVDSRWGQLRAKYGHRKPYGLKYIQVDNERTLTRGYLECIKKFAEAAWEVDPEMTIMTSLNIGPNGYKRGTAGYALAVEMAGWFIAKGKGDKLAWDPHYDGTISFADSGARFENVMGITLQQELAKDFPGFKLNLHPMEENGGRCDWDRGLAHAHNWNTLQRYGDCFRMIDTANTFQPHGLHYDWNQGRIHFLADTLWFQPSAHIDEMMMKTWKPNVVFTESSDSMLDITAKINDRKTEMTLYVANLGDSPCKALIDIRNFHFRGKAEIHTIGDCKLTEFNTYDHKDNVVFKSFLKKFPYKKDVSYTFPKYSYTVITIKK